MIKCRGGVGGREREWRGSQGTCFCSGTGRALQLPINNFIIHHLFCILLSLLLLLLLILLNCLYSQPMSFIFSPQFSAPSHGRAGRRVSEWLWCLAACQLKPQPRVRLLAACQAQQGSRLHILNHKCVHSLMCPSIRARNGKK